MSWRIGGVALGLLVTAAIAVQGPIGFSTAYVSTESALAAALFPAAAQRVEYWRQLGFSLPPEWWLMVGLFIGGGVSALLARRKGATPAPAIPRLWTVRFGGSRALRFAMAAAGGFLVIFGARLAGGCTSGHVVSGISQLAVSGMVFAGAVFLAGIPVARALFGRSTP